MHAPLTPPPGYEKYATMREALPGLKDVPPIQSFSQFKLVLFEACKLYLHYYFPNPDILRREQEEAEAKKRSIREELETLAEERKQVIRKSKRVLKSLQRELPSSQEALAERLSVLHDSLEEFKAGFHEASSGTVDIFGRGFVDPDDHHPDNKPILYFVEEEGDSASDKHRGTKS
jgi:predicted nuclease with TOPRIM domain